LVKQFAEFGDSPYLLVRNLLSAESLPLTPTDDRSPDEQGWREQAAALLGMLAACGATAASFEDEMGGRLCHMVMPAKNSETSYSRSTKPLNFHTEVVNGYFAEEAPSHVSACKIFEGLVFTIADGQFCAISATFCEKNHSAGFGCAGKDRYASTCGSGHAFGGIRSCQTRNRLARAAAPPPTAELRHTHGEARSWPSISLGLC
jgi:hypothetical protein